MKLYMTGGNRTVTTSDGTEIVGANDIQAYIIEERDKFVTNYCETKGWNRLNLTMEQILEIRQQNGWKTPNSHHDEQTYQDTDFVIADSKEDVKVIVDDATGIVFYTQSSVKKKAEMFDRIFEEHKDKKPVCFCSVCQVQRTMLTNELMDGAVGKL